jgi:iron-sulfur cluster assembly protein
MIEITESAIKEIKRLSIKETCSLTNQLIGLRIQVVGGGCSGMSYKMTFDPNLPDPTDVFWLDWDGLVVIIDAKSLLFLDGVELDFTDGLDGKGFVFNNPNAKRTCGCGTSFQT